MQAIIGFVLGIATVILLREYAWCKPQKRHKEPSEEQARVRREYENFLRYDGEEQE